MSDVREAVSAAGYGLDGGSQSSEGETAFGLLPAEPAVARKPSRKDAGRGIRGLVQFDGGRYQGAASTGGRPLQPVPQRGEQSGGVGSGSQFSRERAIAISPVRTISISP
jgi:hypothetical protein